LKVGIVRFSSLGDIVIASSLIETITKEIPDAEIFFITKWEFKGIYEKDKRIAGLISYPQKGLMEIARFLRREADLKIDIHRSLRSFLLRKMSGGSWRIYNGMRMERRELVRKKKGIYISPLYLRYNETVKDMVRRTDYKPRLETNRYGEEILKKRGLPLSPFIIAPYASRRSKEWKMESYAEVAKVITRDFPVFIVGSPHEWKRGEELRKMVGKGCYNLAGSFRLWELKEIFVSSRGVLGGDTGLLHIADALDVPAVMLFISTHPSLGFAPTRPTTIVISSDVPCQPCHVHGVDRCPRGSFECLDRITPERVISAIREMWR
jgi:heptosyltransferase-2